MYVFIGTSHRHYYDNATSCIQHFLHDLKELSSESAYTFNAHLLSHIPEFVQQLGPLDKFSAFPFENYLYLLKQRIKTGTYVFEQSINSVLTIRSFYSNVSHKKFVFSNKYPNNIALVLHHSNIVPIIITSVSDLYVASGFLLTFKSDFYVHPYPSSSIGIGRYILSSIYVTDVKIINKCICFIDGNEYIIIPFANNLIYYLHDKSIAIVHIDDVIGWTPEEFEKLKICRRVELKVNNDDMKVLVLQCAANYDALKETSKFVVEMKRKKQTISFIQTHFNPARGLNRQRLPPVYPPHTASEDSVFDTDLPSQSMTPHSKDKSFSLKPLPPLKTPTFPVTLKSLSENKISMSQSPLPNLDCIRTSLNLSDAPSFQLPVSSIQPILSHRDSSDLSLLRMHDSMLGVCSRLKVEPFSSQGLNVLYY
ncbi:uncharacterized protein LOC136083096 [Hydra vulgaris]|uniref:Uncharacterized protein LOC136083096 n=1 Tax=Hydra vulgaris TaxID=6087 RepID=A0ABM4CA89_HYDVU